MKAVEAPRLPAHFPSNEYLANGGDVARLISAFDWGSTSVGPIAAWPGYLRTTVATMLASPVPIVTLWNIDGVMIYNQAYSSLAAERHPQLLGSRVREAWPEFADFNDNVMRTVLGGGTLIVSAPRIHPAPPRPL